MIEPVDGSGSLQQRSDLEPQLPVWQRPWWIVGFGIGAVSLIATLLSLLDGPLSPTKIGTVGDWITGFGAILAVGVALRESHTSASNHRAERREDREADQRAEAASVIAMMDLTQPTVILEVRNHSSRPIRWVTVDVELRSRDQTLLPIDPGRLPLRVAQLPPGETRAVGIPIQSVRVSEEDSQTVVRFVDIFGRRWLRSGPPPGELQSEPLSQ